MHAPSGQELPRLAARWVAAIASRRPVFARLSEYGEHSVGAFVAGFAGQRMPAIQTADDYVAQMEAAARRTQGDAVAARLRERLQRMPVVFTANHLSLETLPLTVQSMLVAALGEPGGSVVPVEATGIIPADNASYPIGLLLSRREQGKALRVPILELSKKQRRQITLRLDAYSAPELAQAERAAQALASEARIGARERDALVRVFDVLKQPGLLNAEDFKDQVERAAPALWKLWFRADAHAAVPDLVYCNSEAIRTPLLIADLQDCDTLVHRLFFDATLRNAVLRSLDGIAGCWTDAGRAGGSVLLWEVSADRRTSPLIADDAALVCADGRRIALTVDAIVEELTAGRAAPTTFMSLLLPMVRGLVQIGGFNQIDYLLAIQRGLSAALATAGYREWAEKLATPPPPMLTAGLSGFLAGYAGGDVATAGGIELIAHGGLGRAELERARALTVTEAMAPELPGIARMVLGEQASAIDIDAAEWSRQLAQRLPVLRMD